MTKTTLLFTAMLISGFAHANNCFWEARMQAKGQDHDDAFDYENVWVGHNDSYDSGEIKQGFARQTGMIDLVTNEAAARTSFSIDPTNQTLQVYSYAEVFQNPITASEAGSQLALRDYYQAAGNDPLEIRVTYSFSDWYYGSGDAGGNINVFAQAYKTDGQIYGFFNDVINIAEGIFFTGKETVLPDENMLAYKSTHGDTSPHSLQDFSYTFPVNPGEIVALDTLVGSFCAAGGWMGGITGKAYAATKHGTRPGIGSSNLTYFVKYNVEVISGTGSFEPYIYIPQIPEPAGKMEQSATPGKLNLVIAGVDTTDYQVEVSSNLVDWTTWFYATGTGTPIQREIDPSGTNTCYYRITPTPKKK